MSSPNQSSSPPTSPSPSAPPQPASPAPVAPPSGWSELSGYRETCLLHLEREDAQAFRSAGAALHRLALESPTSWPGPESALERQARAVLADLRYVQGYLAMMGDEGRTADLPPAEEELAQRAEQLARRLQGLSQDLETALA